MVRGIKNSEINEKKSYELKAMNATNPDFWKKFVIPTVLKRDNYTCQECGSEKNLDVAHKRYGEDISIKDLITLCRSCHKKYDSKKTI